MKRIKLLLVGLLAVSLVSVPVVADAHWHHRGGGLFLGFGAGLLSGYLLAPRPVYVAPPVFVAPPPVYAPTPPPAYQPPESGYSYGLTQAVPPPTAQGKCREWRMIDRHLENRWDSYAGRWQSIPVEKWGWVDVLCNQ
jgi:hypothetical protein